jgi:hypothetical protein
VDIWSGSAQQEGLGSEWQSTQQYQDIVAEQEAKDYQANHPFVWQIDLTPDGRNYRTDFIGPLNQNDTGGGWNQRPFIGPLLENGRRSNHDGVVDNPYAIRPGDNLSSLNGGGVNPSKGEINAYLGDLSKQYGVPLRALQSLIWTESNYTQFTSDGKTLVNGTAIGLGQLQPLNAIAQLKGDADRAGSEWKYNLDLSVRYYSDAYNGRNGFSTLPIADRLTDERRAIGAYSAYQHGPSGARESWSEKYLQSRRTEEQINFKRNYENQAWR